MSSEQDEITRLTEAVARYFGTQPQCVAASGLLVQAGHFLGYELSPRPVSMLTQGSSPASLTVAVGKLARDFAAANGSIAENLQPPIWGNDFDEVGHMIVTSEKGWVLDPTFQQLSVHGFPTTPIIGDVDDVHPVSDSIDLSDDELKIRYWFVDACSGWRASYKQFVTEHLEEASSLARLIRSGRL